MDDRLVAWARAVKARRSRIVGARQLPVLWLFTDTERLPDPLPAIARLPRGLCGVVFRHDGVPRRAALARRVARQCRSRRIALTIAGDADLARQCGVGAHLREGRGACRHRSPHAPVSSSAHSLADIRRAARQGADLCFLSPVFPTLSHPGAAALGVLRFAYAARAAKGIAVLALGGVDGRQAGRLPRFCAGAAAIGALL